MTGSHKKILREYFGYDSFRGHQEKIILHLLEGGDAFALMPTGAGKSLCYQIPAMVRDGVGVVISPLIALMQDQVDALRQIGVRADFLNSSLTPGQADAVMKRVVSGGTDILYVAPERFLMTGFQRLLNQTRIALFAVDEAHCVSQWGHDFRPEYLRLSVIIDQYPGIPRFAATAAADKTVRKEILEKLGLLKAEQFIASFDRPNIRYRVSLKQNANRQLFDFLKNEHPEDSGIVYCLSRKKTESTAKMLADAGFNALPYHAGMPQNRRLLHQRRFQSEEGVIVVATIAFGMGIDKPDVRFVAHIDLPKNLESYYQETGRAGRDGKSADAWMIYSLGDIVKLRQFMESSQGDKSFRILQHRKTEAMLGYCETTVCRRKILLGYFGEVLENDCGNCDTCLGNIETWDGTIAAQKALSAVYRTGQKFGAAYLVDILLGQNNERVSRFRHDRIKTFGVGTEHSPAEWKSVFRQLVAAGLLNVDFESKGGFYLSNESWPVLRGERQVMLRKDPKPVKPAKKVRPAVEEITDPGLRILWDVLRDYRLEVARENQVPPYVVFHDATLREIVFRTPRSEAQLGRINGIGKTKLDRYGKAIVDIVTQHVNEYGLPEKLPPTNDRKTEKLPPSAYMTATVIETFELFQKGMTPERIADQRDLKVSTIYTHLEKAIEAGRISAGEVVSLPGEETKEIEKAISELPEGQKMALSPIFEKFNGKYDYGLLKCIRAGMDISEEQKPAGFEKRIVCLANSRKYSNYCIAGKDVGKSGFGKWIRPVSAAETGELPLENILLGEKMVPEILDIVAIPMEKHAPDRYQTENYLIDPKRKWMKRGAFHPSRLPELLDDTTELWIDGFHSLNGLNDRIPAETVNEKISTSLLFVRPENFRIIVRAESGKTKIRARFVHKGTEYLLAVTDMAAEREYLKKEAGEYPTACDPFLCLSLSEPYNDFCYKLVAGILMKSLQ